MMDERQATLVKALAFEEIGAILGGSLQWSVETIEYVAEVVNSACQQLGLPWVSDQDKEALTYWAEVGDKFGVEHDDPEEAFAEPGGDFDEWHLGDLAEINWAGSRYDGEVGHVVHFTPEGGVVVQVSDGSEQIFGRAALLEVSK